MPWYKRVNWVTSAFLVLTPVVALVWGAQPFKVVQSAVSNLMVKSKNIDEDSIRISSVTVNEGPTLKRWMPRARGRADRILKRTCHIAVVVSGEEIQK